MNAVALDVPLALTVLQEINGIETTALHLVTACEQAVDASVQGGPVDLSAALQAHADLGQQVIRLAALLRAAS